ncbi:nucleoside recognition protein [Parablautia sp. Marseille-Q6255]|uniref:nucleoside recognition protein n=1 Tax=Parablautia sp. Marseille-Q6255 TaxID=3039593 RepID=UPI0024BCEC38|nr:nucleoside recognition protein [Parablautia sp. Marseille-Q6255]
MNYIWGGMILAGVVWGTLTGNVSAVSDAVLDSAREAVTLCITMLGVMGLWMGLMEIASEAGLVQAVSRKIRPFIRFLFPNIPKEHPANEHITMNCVANILGLGWAATPAGLKAMEALAQLEEERRQKGCGRAMSAGVASNEMCTFLILNISSLQLIPVNVIAYRAQYGSVNPAAIVGPGIVATAASTAAAVLFCKWMDRKSLS